MIYAGAELVGAKNEGRIVFWEGPKCLLPGAEVTFHEGPKCLDEGPKCILQKGAEIVGAEMVGAIIYIYI